MPTVYHLLTEREPFSKVDGGGISRWAGNVVPQDPKGVVVAPSADGTWELPPEQLLIEPGLLRYKTRTSRLSRLAWDVTPALAAKLLLPTLLKRVRPGDIVWVHNRPEFAAGLARLSELTKLGIKVVLHMHNSHLYHATRRVRKNTRGVTVVFVSRYMRDEAAARESGWATMPVLYNGADEATYGPAEASSFGIQPANVLFLGRLIPEKGCHILTQAMKILDDRGFRCECRVVGGAGFGVQADTDYIRDMKRSAPPNVRFLGYLPGEEIAKSYREAWMFCQPSLWQDPSPVTTLEAMASGIPVVAFRSGGIPEMLEFGGGVVVEESTPESLADAIQAVASNGALRAEMATAGRQSFLDRFTWRHVFAGYRQICEQVAIG